jgi:RecA/RadA recombinase
LLELLLGTKHEEKEPKGEVIHIYGEAGSGKTLLAIYLAYTFCSLKKQVVLIDTEGKILGHKIKQLIPPKKYSLINQFLKIFTIDDFTAQQELIQNIERFLINKEVSLIMIDTITNLYRQKKFDEQKRRKLSNRLAFQVAHLRKIAYEKNIIIVLFNQVTMKQALKNQEEAFIEEEVSPVAQAIMNYWVDKEIFIKSLGWGEFIARKARKTSEKIKFKINEHGKILTE